MDRPVDHGRIIAGAAKAALAPLGCKRIGRSRSWVSDERFWAIVIEFQPSGWSKGSYLNVGAMWLWSTGPGWRFDYGYRIEEFHPFTTAPQFTEACAFLAQRAVGEVLRLRELFPSIRAVADRLSRDTPSSDWPLYHGAIAAGLVGDRRVAGRLLETLVDLPGMWDWQFALRARAASLLALVDDPEAFRATVLAMVAASRQARKLPSDPTCLDDTLI